MSEDKKQSGVKGAKKEKVVFKSWIKSRRDARPQKGPWKGVFRDPVKLCIDH